MQNYTEQLKQIRQEIDDLQRRTGELSNSLSHDNWLELECRKMAADIAKNLSLDLSVCSRSIHEIHALINPKPLRPSPSISITNSPHDSRDLLDTDYWTSPAGLAGKPVLSYSSHAFRLLLPVKSALGERHSAFTSIMSSIMDTTCPEIFATPSFVSIIAGCVAMNIAWSEVHGITLDQFPTHPQACDFLTYTFAGKRGPRKSFGRKATYHMANS